MRALLFCGLASLLISPTPSITAQEPTAPQVSPEEALLDQIQGGWALREMEVPGLDRRLRQERAIMVVGGSFLSIELHLAWDVRENDEWIDGYFQAGVSRIWFEPSGELVAKSMIGATTNEDYELVLEPAGKERRYDFKFYGNDELELMMEDGPRFRFQRLRNGNAPTDVLGRPIKKKN